MLQLLNIRTGSGAVILPPSPAPQLTSIFVRYPRTRGHKPGKKTDGINKLLKEYLPRLKYYNPAIRIEVDNPSNIPAACMLRLQFEGTDPDALRGIAHKSSRTKEEIRGPRRLLENPPEPASADGPNSRYTFTQHRPSADDDEVVVKAQPIANPSSPSTVSPPTPIYTRTVTLATNYRPHWEIWKWMRRRTGGMTVRTTEADQKLSKEIREHEKASAETREQMKELTAKIKDEQAALAKAKKAAEAVAAGNS